ncbi:MAG: hypothetical protein HY906_15235, partial [Deltaproteobacteria bacterium]|nr:hypothetical protein [Deltaproteobacteria bacterium]
MRRPWGKASIILACAVTQLACSCGAGRQTPRADDAPGAAAGEGGSAAPEVAA